MFSVRAVGMLVLLVGSVSSFPVCFLSLVGGRSWPLRSPIEKFFSRFWGNLLALIYLFFLS
jgi:hypothetical protein